METHTTFFLDDELHGAQEDALFGRFSDLVTSTSEGRTEATVVTDAPDHPDVQALRGELEALGFTVERVEVETGEEVEAQLRFAQLVGTVEDLTGLAERAGLSRRALEYKRRGERRVTQWDVWALERAVEVGAGRKAA